MNTNKQYKLTDYIRRYAYYAVIDNREIVIDFERNSQGEPNSMHSSVGHLEGDSTHKYFVSDNKDYLDNLTQLQVKELAYAGVIKVTKEDKHLTI